MPNAAFAEWLISRFTERGRAASIVGDLLEVTAKQSGQGFWLAVAGVVLAAAWRPLAAFGAAVFYVYLLNAFARSHSSLHQPPHTALFGLVAVVTVFLWMAVPYTLICYGIRDRFAQLALASSVPSTVTCFLGSVPGVTMTSLALAAAILLLSLRFAQGRRALLALAIALGIGYAGFPSTIFLLESYLEIASPSVTRTVVVHHSIPFFVALFVAAGCSWTHQFLLSHKDSTMAIPATTHNP